MPELLEVMKSMDGFSSVRGAHLDEAAMAAANDLILNADRMPTHRWEYLLKEAITTSDFPLLLGGILDRSLLASYTAAIPDWRNYIYVGQSKDFREKEIHKRQGLDGLLDRVGEKGEYLIKPVSDAHHHLHVTKYGNQFDISWESLTNDDLGAFADIPEDFANAATYTEAYLATGLFCVAAGPNPALFGAPIVDVDGQNVINQGVLPLTIANLETTIGLMARQTDVNGKALGIRAVHLVVPTSLEITGRNILTSVLKQWTEVGFGGGIPVPTANVLTQMGLQLHVNPMLETIDQTADDVDTWYLFADKGSAKTMKAMEFDYLLGHETPEICMKASDKVSVTGAPISPFAGDFATDNVFYRVRIVCGGSPLDPRCAYAQVAP